MLTSIDAARDFEAYSADVDFDGDMRLLFQTARTILWMLLLMATFGCCSRWCGRYYGCCSRHGKDAHDVWDDNVVAPFDG